MATEYVLTARGSRWIERFRDEDHARRMVAKRGHTLTDIVVATDDTRRALAEWQEAEERRKQQAAANSSEEAGTTGSDDLDTTASVSMSAVPDWLKDNAVRPAGAELAGARSFRVGRILDRGFSIIFRNLVPYFVVSAVIVLPSIFIPFGFWALVIVVLKANNVHVEYNYLLWIVSTTLFALHYLMYCLACAALAHGIVRNLGGHAESVFSSIRQGAASILIILGVSALSGFAYIVGTIALVIPGYIVATIYWVVLPVAVIEKRGVVASFIRSDELTRGYRWKICWIISLVGGIQSVTTILTMMAAVNTRSGLVTLITYFGILAFFSVVWAVFIAVVYHDLRVAKGETDIDNLAAVFD